MKVLVIPDKFKGTLRAAEAAEAIASGWREGRPNDELELLPMSDGGDGFGEIIGTLLQAEKRTSETVNAAHEVIQADWWWAENSRTAIVESANVIGLAMLPAGRFHPFELDTVGLGQLLRQIARENPDAGLIIGIGGSATNDGGFGMARGLGYRFVDHTGHCVDRWVALDSLLRIEAPQDRAGFGQVTIACDVQNPLMGPQGASRVYGPQKGLRAEDFAIAEKCLGRLVEVARTDLRMDCSEEAGAGAAGGLGYGLRVFQNGKFEPGFDIFSRLAGLPARIRGADLIITAEGSIDAQTEMGKGTGTIAKLAREHGKRCVGLAGYLPEKENRAFDWALGIAPELTSVEEAKRQPADWLRKLSALAATRIAAMAMALLTICFAGCQTATAPRAEAVVAEVPEAPVKAQTAEERAVTFLAREVPAWFRDNGCYSCHNNGDGARALMLAAGRGHDVGEALQETMAWLRQPEDWDENKGDPAFSDQRLADIQFAFALYTATAYGQVDDFAALGRAARRLLEHQEADGSWQIEPQNAAGSPVTYGTTLGTYIAWKILSVSDDPAVVAARGKAADWLARAPANNIPAAAALLLFATDTNDIVKQNGTISYLTRNQLINGGWGPFPQAPAENFDTALVLLALAHGKARAGVIERGREFLVTQQNADGSWAATTRPTGGESYAQQISTTAWATLALLSIGGQ